MTKDSKKTQQEVAAAEQVDSAVASIKSAMGRSNGDWATHSQVKDGRPCTEFGVRHYGTWEMPDDCDEDEDDGDYDWEVLSDDTAEKVNKIISKIRSENPDVEIDWFTSEKNWIDITVRSKLITSK